MRTCNSDLNKPLLKEKLVLTFPTSEQRSKPDVFILLLPVKRDVTTVLLMGPFIEVNRELSFGSGIPHNGLPLYNFGMHPIILQ